MSLLIVRCPLKPFSGAVSASPSDWQDLACAEQFEWCLLDSRDGVLIGESAEPVYGVGTTESMPYADEALVLLPTLDVRLIDTKVPLANPKKLQQILPNLIEDFVLSGVESISAQAFPPVPGNSALQRTVALIDRNWFNWLSKQLEHLLAPRVRLIPECLLLNLAAEGGDGFIAYQRVEENIIFTQRTSLQLGVSWVENVTPGLGEQGFVLPKALAGLAIKEISWSWVPAAACEYLQINSDSRSANFALNLLPPTFRRNARSIGKVNLASLKGIFSGKSLKDSATAIGLAWTDPLVWRQTFRWLRNGFLSLVIGHAAYLSWMLFDNWRWGKQMEVLAAQSLTPASIASLNQTKLSDSGAAILNTFTKQVTSEQRRRGIVVDADFSAMAVKLQQLKMTFGAEVLQKVDYDGYAITFEFKSDALMIKPNEVLARGRALGMSLKYLGANRYQLNSYSGLGSES